MNLTVKGKNIDIGDALKTRAQESLDHIFGKYFSNPIEASVTMSRETYFFQAQIAVHVGRGILLQAEGQADTANAAYDAAAETLAKRLRRYKRRLRDHHRAATESMRAQAYILAAEPEEAEEPEAAPANGEAPPVVVAEMQTDIPTLTVSEAVMRLDLANSQAMMFLNRAHGGLNMVYRRNDGNIGWVDPQLRAGA
ncbi:SSU ribosomal protein S30P /sigma 54 modulation protein [Dongia mobilis]|uniref:Ribosome hibernation promoting factor n=1 Tax=Dongia mobilis TaxID=578943 RepID=A0A4R6WTB6_9PROT|nr:ribosome-associated translation inhibitor RaiA [Dongia mobilis]TDQ82130.1 SSU ribosomal protein S30P /sigma 54 modulation protein [Dongia mobilis]